MAEEQIPQQPNIRKRWYRRRLFIIPAIFGLAVLIVAGVLAFRIQRTFSTLNEVSTPESSISGAVLGGDPSLKIDTGPAMTAMAQQGQPTMIPTNTSAPAGTPTPDPTESQAHVTSSPTVAASPAAPSNTPTVAEATETATIELSPTASPTEPAAFTQVPESTVTDEPKTETIATRPAAVSTPTTAPTSENAPAPSATIPVMNSVEPSTPTLAPASSTSKAETVIPATFEPSSTPTSESALPPPPGSTASATLPQTATSNPPTEIVQTQAATGQPIDPPTTEPTITPSPEPTIALTESPTMTPSPTPAATATATPILSDIERINNRSFESNDAWDMESGAAIVETDAVDGTHALELPAKGAYAGQTVYFLAGTTYQLSAWGKVGAEGESGEIGLAYVDADGQRLSDLEPAPLVLTSTSYEQMVTSITIPDGVASVNVYAYKDAGDSPFYADQLSFRSEVGETETPAVSDVDDDAINILIMGVDARPGEAIDIGVRPDSLMVLRLDPDTDACRVLAIPRDTRTELPGYGLSKINNALAVGGIPYEQQVVEKLTGLTIDHYVLIDFDGFEEMVDAVGGITITVTEAVTIEGQDLTYEPGEHTLTGAQALNYARYRGGTDGDFGRIQRQQQVLRGLINKSSGLNVVKSINELLPAVSNNLRTDLSVTEMTNIALDYRSTCTDDSIEFFRLDGYNAWFDDPILQIPQVYVIVDEAEVRSKVAMLLGR